jgi:hypothetical protein
VSLFLPNSAARVRFDEPYQESQIGSPVTVRRRLAGVQLDSAQMLGALVAILLGAEQANRRAVITIQRGSTELVGQQHVIAERVGEREGRAVAIRPFKEDMAHVWFKPCFGDDDRFIERSKSHATPAQVSRRPAGDAVEVSNKRSPLEFGEARDGDLQIVCHRSHYPDQRRFRDRGRRFRERDAEPRKATDVSLSWWQAHSARPVRRSAPSRDDERARGRP